MNMEHTAASASTQRAVPQIQAQTDSGGIFLWISVGLAALLALGLSIAGLVLPRDGDGSGGSGAVAKPKPKTVNVQLGDLFVQPKSVTVEPGTDVTLLVRNVGALNHDLKVNETTGTKLLEQGQFETLKLGVVDASTTLWCTVAGHRDAGMTFDVIVAGTPAAAGAVGGAAMPHMASAAATGGAVDQNAPVDFNAKPSNTS
jgi:nitrite reductase (NO-forming)